DLCRSSLVRQVHAGVMVGDLARLVRRDIQRARLASENGLYLLDDMVRLERLAVIFQNQVAHAKAGLGAQVTRELSCVVALDTNDAFTGRQNLADLFRVERGGGFDLKGIGREALFAERL